MNIIEATLNVLHLFEKSAAENPGSLAIKHSAGEISYAVLLDAVRRLAGGLVRKGVGRDSRIALILPNIPHFVISYLAIFRSGAVVVPIQYGLSEYELLPMLEEAEVDTIICWSGDLLSVQNVSRKLQNVKRVIVLGETKSGTTISLTRLISQSQPLLEPVEIDDDDVALIRVSNGRTGRPVAAEFTHQALFANCVALRDTLEITQNDLIATLIPLADVTAEGLVLNLSFSAGCGIILSPGFEWSSFASQLKDSGATLFVGYPSHFIELAKFNFENFHSTTLRLSLCTGGSLEEEVLKNFERIFGGYTLEGYALGEAGPVIALNKWRTGRRVGSLGHPLPGIDMRILGKSGKECSIGEIGEIVVRGSSIMRGFSGRQRLSTLRITDRWLKSGDFGRMDINGFFYYSGCEIDRIVTDGKAFYVHEIERLLNLHPGVAESVVVIVEDDGMLLLKACVVPSAIYEFSTEEIDEFLHRHLSDYKCPDLIRIYKSLPQMKNGEVDREELSGAVHDD